MAHPPQPVGENAPSTPHQPLRASQHSRPWTNSATRPEQRQSFTIMERAPDMRPIYALMYRLPPSGVTSPDERSARRELDPFRDAPWVNRNLLMIFRNGHEEPI